MKADNHKKSKNVGRLGGKSGLDHSYKEKEKTKDLEDNALQRGLTTEGDDQEDVSGDLAGNAAGNPDE